MSEFEHRSEAIDCMDAGGTSPWMGEGRTMQELLSQKPIGIVTRTSFQPLTNRKLLPLIDVLIQ
jgi:hypothetical protein